MTIFQFNPKSDISNWHIVNDTVMGGISTAKFSLSKTGNGIFKGHVSLENNGGFAMVQYNFNTINVEKFSKVVIKVKGDGKRYQFRIKTSQDDKHSYIATFTTTKDWLDIEIPFAAMYPAYRGKRLQKENYPGKQMELIALLIGNKTEEYFCLEVGDIKLK